MIYHSPASLGITHPPGGGRSRKDSGVAYWNAPATPSSPGRTPMGTTPESIVLVGSARTAIGRFGGVPALGARTLMDGTLSLLTDPFGRYQMGCTAEIVAERFGISRAEQDAYAAESQRRTAAAIEAGLFREQIVPVTVRKGKEQ